jgi:c-di-GMP phosphodiesterase
MMLAAVQPILDNKLNIVAREIYFRDQNAEEADIVDADKATCNVLLNAFTNMHSTKHIETGLTFVNVTPNLLTISGFFESFEQGIIYKLNYQDIENVDAVVNTLKSLKEKSYIFALGGVTSPEQVEPFKGLVTYLKVAVNTVGLDQSSVLAKQLNYEGVELIAEKIETFEQLDACICMGFKKFQGYFLSKPRVVSGAKLETNAEVVLTLINELHNADATPEGLEMIVMRDVGLTVKLLRICNSAAFGLSRKVNSIKDAIVFLGFNMMRHWTSLIAMGNLKPKSPALFYMQLIRARMCENLATLNQAEEPKRYFLAGLLSSLDAILDIEMESIMEQMPLDTDIANAVSFYEGKIGEILINVIKYETSDWDSLEAQALAEEAYSEAYIEALEWATKLMGTLLNE